MLKSTHREVVIFLLGGLAALGGSNLTQGKHASLPEGCELLFDPLVLDRIEEMLKDLNQAGRIAPQIVPPKHRELIFQLVNAAVVREALLVWGKNPLSLDPRLQ